MSKIDEPFSAKSARYLAEVDQWVAKETPLAILERVEALVLQHDTQRRSRCLNMNAAEAGMSRRSLTLLASDMATRLSEGLPGDKLYPHGQQNVIVDELEAIIISQIRRQFGARFVEWRPVSTSMANAALFSALLKPGDNILVQDEDNGGNYSYHQRGPAGLFGARITPMKWHGETFEIDPAAIADQVQNLCPKMIVIGGSNVLFPYPVQEIRHLADKVGALLVYDAAHLGLLISRGDFQRPLEEGAHAVTISTHKIMGGPVGGVILTNDAAIARSIVEITFPGFMQTRDQNKYAALAASLAETVEFGALLAARMVANARALAKALSAEGFEIVAGDRGYTHTHQIFLRLGDHAQRFEARCQAANILVSDCALAGDMAKGLRSGARLATHELTRGGMAEANMVKVARLIGRAAGGEDPQRVARDVEVLLRETQTSSIDFDREMMPASAGAPQGRG